MDQLDLHLAMKRIGQSVQAVARHTVNTRRAYSDKGLREPVWCGQSHVISPWRYASASSQ
jgi:hypothetical protein